ncbi:MAG: hypothetical protein HYY40_06400 [Bacteroidetes bacterium]|nr:hypothetical protein [Bacteroidota bacterium]
MYFILCIIASPAFPQDTTWRCTYGGAGYDEGRAVIETSDTNYLVVGATGSFGYDNADVYVNKIVYGDSIKKMRRMYPADIPFQKQEKSNWCWAACLQSLFTMVRNPLTQSEIVSAFFGEPIDRALPFDSVAFYLNITPWFKAKRIGRPMRKLELIEYFQDNKKIIAFILREDPTTKKPGETVMGHSVLLQGNDIDLNIYVSDPETGLTTKESLDEVYEKWRWVDAIVVELTSGK